MTSDTAPDTNDDATESDQSSDSMTELTRRNAAKYFAGIAGAASIGSFAVTSLSGMGSGALHGGNNLTYKNIYVQGTHLVNGNGNRISPSTIKGQSGKEMMVFPEKKGGGPLKKHKTTTLLARFDESQYNSPTKKKWTVKGYCAYSAVCTHEGCIVSKRAGPHNDYFHCPCHQSTYDPLKGCKVVGGPAPRPLPQLPIGVTKSGKFIVATGPFEGPIGPQ